MLKVHAEGRAEGQKEKQLQIARSLKKAGMTDADIVGHTGLSLGYEIEKIMTIETINPATGQVIQSYQEMNSREVEAIIESTHIAFLEWRNTSFTRTQPKT